MVIQKGGDADNIRINNKGITTNDNQHTKRHNALTVVTLLAWGTSKNAQSGTKSVRSVENEDTTRDYANHLT